MGEEMSALTDNIFSVGGRRQTIPQNLVTKTDFNLILYTNYRRKNIFIFIVWKDQTFLLESIIL